MCRTFFIGLAIGFISHASPTQAGLLFERTMSVNRSVNIFDTNQFDLDVTFANRFFNPTNPVTLFDSLKITPDDVGSSFSISSGDPLFADADLRLTDDLDEQILILFTEDQPNGLTEQRGWSESFFFFDPATLATVDLAGASLESIGLRVDQFTLVTGSSLTVATGPPVDLQMTISFFGSAIPEPASIWILWAGVATLGIRPPTRSA